MKMDNYALINTATGTVENVFIWNGTDVWAAPEGFHAIQTDVAGIGWSYVDGEFTAPELPPSPAPSAEQILAINTAFRDALLAQATLAIAPLQDAVDLDEATSAEADQLKKWKQYRVAVNRIDLTQANPTWPPQP
jgi:hypothetical protein